MDTERIVIDIDFENVNIKCDLSNNGEGCSFDGIYSAAITLLGVIKNDVEDFDEFMECVKEDVKEHGSDEKERLLC